MANILQNAAGWLGNTFNQPIKIGTQGGIQLPDFGVSEWLSGYASQPSTPQSYAQTAPQPQPQGQGVSTVSGGTTGGRYVAPTGQVSQPQQQQQSSGPSQEEMYRQQMEGLIGQNENDLMAGLQPSYQNQLNMANQWGQQSTSDLNSNVQSNVNDLNKQTANVETGQVKSLKDVAENIRNLMQAGNTYLGSRGAGDSSAVDAYSYALTKLGSQQRGDVMAQSKDQISKINDNIAKVNLVATQEKQKIDYEVGQKTQEIAQWFADQQTQIKSAANKDKQALATNLYNQAVSQLAQLQNYAQSRQAQVESWALSNSTSAKEAMQKIQQYGTYQAAAPVYNPIQGNITTDAGGNMSSGFKGGGTGGLTNLSEDQKRLLGIA